MKKFINTNLVSLKCVIFLFLAGVGCLFPFLPLHMKSVEMTLGEACLISIVAPIVSILGPLIAGPLADKLSVGRGSQNAVNNGPDANQSGNKVLRIMLAVCFVCSALFYGLLLAVPEVKILEPRRPSVSFMCGSNEAHIYQEICAETHVCNHWKNTKEGLLSLSSCEYTCEKPPVAYPLYFDATSTTERSRRDDDDDDDEDVANPIVSPEFSNPDDDENNNVFPHLCYDGNENKPSICHVYISKPVNINVKLLSSVDSEMYVGEENETSWCKYPIAGSFQCNIPQDIQEDLISSFIPEDANSTCNPVVTCTVEDPYDKPESVLAESQCKRYIGDPTGSFWMYLVFRSLGDVFATAALCLLCTACVIATRETSLGRGDVGRQLAFGVVGMALIPPIIGVIHNETKESVPNYFTPFIATVILFVLAAIVLILDSGMPLTPPEWWWHTKSGMLALPMNTIRRYSFETVGVFLVLVVLGIFWSTLDTYLAWTVNILKGNDFLISFTMTIGALPAIPILWKAEELVDYCGHSNIFIGAFTFYIIRYTGMALIEDPWWVIFCEVFEVFTISLMWVTAIFYFRHLMPRKYTATGQALAVLAHFCIGRAIGALVGSCVSHGNMIDMLRRTYQGMAIAACVLGCIYLLTYHLILAPMCRETITGPPNQLVMQGMDTNGASNGSYAPLRVYHNERGKKGQFRY